MRQRRKRPLSSGPLKLNERGRSRVRLRSLHDDWLDPERPGDAELVAQAQHASEDISAAMTVGAEPTGVTA